MDEALTIDVTMRAPEDEPQATRHGAGPTTEQGHGDALHCRRCKTVSPATRKFCAQCGEPLWEPCVHCGNVCPAGERFCGICGANLAAAVHQQSEQFEMTLLKAEQLQTEARYEEAVELLSPMSEMTDHPRLSHQAKAATELIKRLGAEREQALTKAEAVYSRGQRCLDDHDYQGAIAVLESVSPTLRNEEFQTLLAEAVSRQQELACLGKELRADLRNKDMIAALPKVARLLELKPGHAQARQLAEQIQKRFAAAAAAKLAQYQYEEAAKLLENIPRSLQIAETAALCERVADLSWITWDLRNAAVVDGPLLAVVERLRALAPDDPRGPKLLEEMQRRAKRAAKSGVIVPPPWASQSAPTPAGFPIDFLDSFRRLKLGESLDRAALSAHPGAFAVACGLALQGLGQAHVQLDLRASERQSALGKVTQLFRRPATAWGLDIGSSSLKAVKLTWNKKEETVALDVATIFEFKKPLGQAAGEEEERAILEESLSAFLTQYELKADQVCLGLPGRIVLTRLFQLPATSRAKLSTMVQYEAKHQLPTPLDQLMWDFQTLGDAAGETGSPPPSEAKKGTAAVLFAAARRKLVDKRLELMQRVGIRVDLLQSECIALHNYLMFERSVAAEDTSEDATQPPAAAAGKAAQSTKPQWPVALLDIGGDGGNMVISSPAGIWVRHLGFGGYSITRALITEFNLTAAQAEEMKRNPASAPSISALYRAVEGVVEDFSREIGISLTAYGKTDQAQPIQQMLGGGGGFQFHGLLAALRSLQ